MTHIFLVRDEEAEECGEVVIKERSDFCLMNIVLAKCVSLDASSQLDDTISNRTCGGVFVFLSTGSGFSLHIDPDHMNMRHESINPFNATSFLLLLLF